MAEPPKEQFWMNDLRELVASMSIIPKCSMERSQRWNTVSRLVIVSGVVIAFYDLEAGVAFIVLGLIWVALLDKFDRAKVREGFSIPPTYQSTDFGVTVVPPMFAEEWQIIPPSYDLYTDVPPSANEGFTFQEPLRPQAYPYGQYLTSTNLLPSDEYAVRNLTGGVKDAREYVNSSFLRNDLAFRENMMRIRLKSLNRRFRMNCQDQWSPFQSY